jgi:CHRD domain-containing protein
MRRIVVFIGLLLGLTIGGAASAATTDDAPPTVPVLTPQTFTVELLPSGDPDGSGTARLIVNPLAGIVCYTIRVTGIGEPTEPAPGVGSAHIHAVEGGGIAVNLETDFVLVGPDTYQAAGCVKADPSVLEAILEQPEQYYVNVHTVAFPLGAVQGSLA